MNALRTESKDRRLVRFLGPIFVIATAFVLADAAGQTRANIDPGSIFPDGAPVGAADAAANSISATPPVYYAVNRATAYASPDSSSPYIEIDAREPVDMVGRLGVWVEIQTADGARGFVRGEVLSNVWIRVSKRSKTVWVYRGPDLAASIPADMAYNFFLDKERRGSRVEPDHWRTPEGLYYVVSKNEQSRFYKAFVLNYPSMRDGQMGLDEGMITTAQYDAIAEADRKFAIPPMDTALGGWIEIHGMGTGSRTAWTRGCVAIPNEAIDDLWALVHVGTPVLIEP